MPSLVWLYLTALLYYRTAATCVALAEALQTVSHDRLTRMLQATWSGPTLLESAWRSLFVWERGDRVMDDTVVPKPFATAMEGLAWVYSSQERKPVYGFSLARLIWPNGVVRIPLGVRLWHRGGPSKIALALALLSSVRTHRHGRPDYVLFDAWYPAKRLLKRIRDDGWDVICRLKKNRRCNGQALRTYRRHPYGAERGWLTGGVKVLVVRYGAKYDATNRLTLAAVEVRRHDRMRAQIEEVIRACTDPLGLGGCQARSERAQLPETCDIDIDQPLDSMPGAPDLRERGMAGASWAKSMRVAGEHRLIVVFQEQTRDFLYELVVARGDAQRSCLPIRFRDIDPPCGFEAVPALFEQPREVGYSLSGEAVHRDGIYPTGHGPFIGIEIGIGLQPQVRALHKPKQAVNLLPLSGDLLKSVQPLIHGRG